MSDTKHTSGPWKAQGYDVRQDGSNGTRFICYTGPHHTPDSEYPPACARADMANARLIAAAPELLKWLEIALDQSYNGPMPDWILEGCAPVIAKAKGESI